MTPEYTSMANSLALWFACAPAVMWVVFQAWIFFKRSRADSLRMGIAPLQVKRAIRSASIASVAPCFVMLSAMLTLMIYVGAPVAWLRVDFIGSVSYELVAAKFAADGMGITLGSAEMDADFLAAAIIIMTTGCVPWVLFAAIFSDKMEKVNAFMSGGNAKLVPVLGIGAVLGCFGSLTIDTMYPLGPSTGAAISSGVLMGGITLFNQKAKLQWLTEWGLTICMLVGMTVAVVMQG